MPAEQPLVEDPRFNQTNPFATDPNAGPGQFTEWGDRAGQIAHAARNRPSIDNIVGSTDPQLREQLVREVFGSQLGETVRFGDRGFAVEVSDIGVDFDHVIANATITDDTGQVVGSTTRRFELTDNEWEAYNSRLYLNDDVQGTGFASAFNQYMENWYIANGFVHVKVAASGIGKNTGGFVWAMNGYDWDGDGRSRIFAAEEALDSIRNEARTDAERTQVRQLDDRLQQQRREINPRQVPTPRELALVGWTPGAKDWAGKRTMINHSWKGRKNLSGPDRAYNQRQAFTANHDDQGAALRVGQRAAREPR